MKGRPVSIKTKLKRGDREKLEAILRKRDTPSIKAKRARALLLLAEGAPPKQVGETVGMSDDAVIKARRRYLSAGLVRAVDGGTAPGASSPYSEKERQQIVAIACSAPPEGRSHWTCTLLAREAVRRGLVDSIGRETVRIILESHELKPWREKNVVHSRTR